MPDWYVKAVLISPTLQKEAAIVPLFPTSTGTVFSYGIGDYRGETSIVHRAWGKANMGAQAPQNPVYKDRLEVAFID
jgi:hypothetical protein